MPFMPMTISMTDRAVERFLEQFADSDVSSAMLASLRDRLEVAPTLAPVQGVHVAEPGGELWVEVPTPDRPGSPEETGAYDVFTAGGRFLGRVEAPSGFRLEGIREDRAYGVWSDELGVEYARTYRVLRPREGSEGLGLQESSRGETSGSDRSSSSRSVNS